MRAAAAIASARPASASTSATARSPARNAGVSGAVSRAASATRDTAASTRRSSSSTATTARPSRPPVVRACATRSISASTSAARAGRPVAGSTVEAGPAVAIANGGRWRCRAAPRRPRGLVCETFDRLRKPFERSHPASLERACPSLRDGRGRATRTTRDQHTRPQRQARQASRSATLTQCGLPCHAECRRRRPASSDQRSGSGLRMAGTRSTSQSCRTPFFPAALTTLTSWLARLSSSTMSSSGSQGGDARRVP